MHQSALIQPQKRLQQTTMHEHDSSTFAYGLWTVVAFNVLPFLFFAVSFIRPKGSVEWRTLGVFIGFIVALSTEMYGLPLSIYFLTQWLIALIMWPILFLAYYRLSMRVEKEIGRQVPAQYAACRDRAPAFVPELSKPRRERAA
jgi:hypothetical protein